LAWLGNSAIFGYSATHPLLMWVYFPDSAV
jgi:hypothetical protein